MQTNLSKPQQCYILFVVDIESKMENFSCYKCSDAILLSVERNISIESGIYCKYFSVFIYCRMSGSHPGLSNSDKKQEVYF